LKTLSTSDTMKMPQRYVIVTDIQNSSTVVLH